MDGLCLADVLVWAISHVKIRDQGQGHFSKGSRSLGNIISYSVAGGEFRSSMALFSTSRSLVVFMFCVFSPSCDAASS